MDQIKNVTVHTLGVPNQIVIPFEKGHKNTTLEEIVNKVGGVYWKDRCDPMIKTLQEQLAEPCHNCQCFKAELKSLRAQLGIE